jgi:hypothetical protein
MAISVDTLLDWALRYRNGGFEGLAPNLARIVATLAPSTRNWPVSSNASSAPREVCSDANLKSKHFHAEQTLGCT